MAQKSARWSQNLFEMETESRSESDMKLALSLKSDGDPDEVGSRHIRTDSDFVANADGRNELFFLFFYFFLL